MESLRQKKIARLIQKDLGEYFIQHFSSSSPGVLITVTQVRVTPDLALAKVYISLFPSTKADSILLEIRQHTKGIRGYLGNHIGKQARVVPELIFFMDDSLDYLDNIEKLLKE